MVHNNTEHNIIQQTSYKLTFMYYNWPRTVRALAPCQHADKLSYQVGEHILQCTLDYPQIQEGQHKVG